MGGPSRAGCKRRGADPEARPSSCSGQLAGGYQLRQSVLSWQALVQLAPSQKVPAE